MQQQLQERLQSLKSEYEAGQTAFAELEAKRENLQATLLRISGAIQVLEELLAEESGEALAASNNAEGVDVKTGTL